MSKVGKVAASAGRKDCRVTRIDVHVVDARWRNFVFAHVHTDDGISGIGEGSCEFQPQMVAAGIEMLAHRVVVGQLGVRRSSGCGRTCSATSSPAAGRW
jgi:L-alanine-DL-glutamate epimerase-like enolase superfamily enzyme